jgi:hypothetical protein
MPAALLIGGLVFFGALVLVSLNQTLLIWSQSQTEAQASFWQTILGAITGKAYIQAITKAVRGPVSRWALVQLAPVARWFAALNGVLVAHSQAVAMAEEGTAAAFERLRHVVIPRAAGKVVQPVKVQAQAAHKAATKAASNATATSSALTHYRVVNDQRVHHATVAVDTTLPKAIGRINTHVGTLDRDITDLKGRTKALEDGAIKTWDWIRRHPLAGATAAMGAAVAVALSRIGFGMFRCRSWQNVGRRLTCGNGASMLNLLDDGLGPFLGALLTAEAIVNFRDLVKVAQTVEHGVATGLQDLLDV